MLSEKGMAASHAADAFDAVAWLRTFAAIGGGYALTAERKLCFMVGECDASDLTRSMAQIVGLSGRQEALKRTIELRASGEAPALSTEGQ